MKAFIATIVSGVIIGVIVWWVTRPPSITTIEGVVYNSQVENGRVANAMVMLEIREGSTVNGPYRYPTDNNGVYQLEFSGLPRSANAIISVRAAGFENPKDVTLNSLSDVTHQDIGLTPLPVAGGPAPGTLHAIAVHPPPFIAKERSLVPRIPFQAKK